MNDEVVIEPIMDEELTVEDEQNVELETDLNDKVVFEVELKDGKKFELLGEIKKLGTHMLELIKCLNKRFLGEEINLEVKH